MLKFFDIPVLNFINHTLSNHFCNYVMPIITRLGQGELYFVIGLLFLFSKKREYKLLGLTLLAALTISYDIVAILKIAVARPRPFMALANIILLGPVEKGYSFPSNHAASAFMMAFLLSSRFKRYALFYAFAALVAFSRVYMGVHYPTDVLGGAVIGITIGWFLVKKVADI